MGCLTFGTPSGQFGTSPSHPCRSSQTSARRLPAASLPSAERPATPWSGSVPRSGCPPSCRASEPSPAQLLAEVGVDLSLFDSPDNLLSFSARGRLLEHCAARTGCQHLGLLVGQRSSLQSLGLVGSLVKYSPDVGTALRSLVRFFHHHTRGAKATLTVDGQLAYFGYEIRQPGTPGTAQVVDGALAVMLNIMQSLCGPGWKPSQVTIAHRKPDDVEPFRQYLPCSAALRRRTERSRVSRRLADVPSPGRRSGTAPAADGADRGHRRRTTGTRSRSRCAACCARPC